MCSNVQCNNSLIFVVFSLVTDGEAPGADRGCRKLEVVAVVGQVGPGGHAIGDGNVEDRGVVMLD